MDNNQSRRVLIATPTYDGKIDVWYATSLMQTLKIISENNLPIEIYPLWLSYDVLIQRARNDCVALALEAECDDIIFIDSDIEWDPKWILQLLLHPVDVVGGVYKRKSDSETVFVVKSITDQDDYWPEDPDLGLIEVSAIGTGFLRLSKKAMQYLWDNSESYVEKFPEIKQRRMIFNLEVIDGALMGEDVGLCYKLKKGGFKIYADPNMTCTHIGNKKYSANFRSWIDNFKNNYQETPVSNNNDKNINNDVKSLYE